MQMQEVWFIAGPTNLNPMYSRFFDDNNIKTEISGCCSVAILETKMIRVNIDNIDIISKILDILNSYANLNFSPRFKLSKPDENEEVYYGEYTKNYHCVSEDGCDCNMLYQYALLETPTTITCFMKNDKYGGDYDILNNKLILTQEEINEINKQNMDEYNKSGSGCCSSMLDFF